MSPLITERSLARTYSHPSVADPYDIVRQYRDVMRYPNDASSTAVANELDLPRGRVRAWLDGAQPSEARAIETARAMGWLDGAWSGPNPALALLCMGTFACGSIQREGYVPSWSPSTAVGRAALTQALETAGVDYRFSDDREGRSAELWPQSHGSLLGRVLLAAGSPAGAKTAGATTLPSWLDTAPADLRRRMARLVVQERGVDYPDKDTRRIQTDRSEGYYRGLADLIEDVTDEPVTVSETGVTISAAAVRALQESTPD